MHPQRRPLGHLRLSYVPPAATNLHGHGAEQSPHAVLARRLGAETHPATSQLHQALDEVGRLQRMASPAALGGVAAVARLLHGLDSDEADREAATTPVAVDVHIDRVAVVHLHDLRLPDPAGWTRAVGPARAGGSRRRRRADGQHGGSEDRDEDASAGAHENGYRQAGAKSPTAEPQLKPTSSQMVAEPVIRDRPTRAGGRWPGSSARSPRRSDHQAAARPAREGSSQS